MNLRDLFILERRRVNLPEITAGGPGSGRHPEGALKQAGFNRDKRLGRQSGVSSKQDHWSHSDGSYYKVTHQLDKDGNRSEVKSWMYRAGKGNGKQDTRGEGGESLASHLGGTGRQGISKWEKDAMAARGCKGANCGRRSKAPGGQHLPRRNRMTKQETDNLMKAGGPGSGRRPSGSAKKSIKLQKIKEWNKKMSLHKKTYTKGTSLEWNKRRELIDELKQIHKTYRD